MLARLQDMASTAAAYMRVESKIPRHLSSEACVFAGSESHAFRCTTVHRPFEEAVLRTLLTPSKEAVHAGCYRGCQGVGRAAGDL